VKGGKMYSGFVKKTEDELKIPEGSGDIYSDDETYYKGSLF
jgi:hypothetical protein